MCSLSFCLSFFHLLTCLSVCLKSVSLRVYVKGIQVCAQCVKIQHSRQVVDTALGERAKHIAPSDRENSLSLSKYKSDNLLFTFSILISPPIFPLVVVVVSLSLLCFSHSTSHLHIQCTLSSHHLFPRPSVSWGCFTGVPAMSLARLGMSITGL